MTFRALLLTALTCMVAVVLVAPPTHFTTTSAGRSPGPTHSTPAAAGGSTLVSGRPLADTPPPDRASGLPPPDIPLARPTRFSWPMAPPHPVVRPFQAPSTPYGPGHRGVDLSAQPNEPVLTAGDGVVTFAGPVAGRGVVSVDHAGGLRTTYEPLAALIPAGTRIARGTVIGHLATGHPGCVDVPACLHWGARRGMEYLDPLGLLSTGRVRLLPWEGDG